MESGNKHRNKGSGQERFYGKQVYMASVKAEFPRFSMIG